MKKIILFLLIISIGFSQSGIEFAEGKFISPTDGEIREIIKKGKVYHEFISRFDENGNINSKHEAKFTLKRLNMGPWNQSHPVFLATFIESREYSGDDFSKKGKWDKSWADGYEQIIAFDEMYIYMLNQLSESSTEVWVRESEFYDASFKMKPLHIMDGKYVSEDGNQEMVFKWSNPKFHLTHEWNGKLDTDIKITGTITSWSYDDKSQGIKGIIFNNGGHQINMKLISSNDKIIVFQENSTRMDGSTYHCITTFDFSEEGKLKWSALNRHNSVVGALEDISVEFTKK
tara:strand:+ start:1570 stop:2433 length:864 start_codon:yes stop_codon:yes gene_type:complete